MQRLAVLADIHGNRWALEAVLDHLDGSGVDAIDTIVNLGDALYGPLDPHGTAQILLARQVVSVCGNQDRAIVAPPQGANPLDLDAVRKRLQPRHLEWLQSLPATARPSAGVLAFHASPESDETYLLWDVLPQGAVRRSPEQVQHRVQHTGARVFLCGHDHVPHTLQLPDGSLVVNPGSVGLPAYLDDEPSPHVMQAWSPHARYAILSETGDGWNVEQHAIVYDWKAAASCAATNGRNDWAQWLVSGHGS